MSEKVFSKLRADDSADLYWARRRAGDDRRILVVATRDTGGTNTLNPVINGLLENSYHAFVMADSPGRSDLEANKVLQKSRHFDVEARLKRLKPDISLIGISDDPSLEIAVSINARVNGTPLFGVEDYPGIWGKVYSGTYLESPELKPDLLFVSSDWAKAETLKSFPDFEPENIVVSGQPASDAKANEDRAGIKNEVRNVLNLRPEEKLFVWMGQLGGSMEALELLAGGINALETKDYRLAIRRHPKDVHDKNDIYNRLAAIEPLLIDTDAIPTSKVAAAADAVATMFSTEGVNSVLRGIPTIHILVPKILDLAGEPHRNVPVVNDGASAVVRDEKEMTNVLQDVLFNDDYRAHLKVVMERYRPIPGATGRVVQGIVNWVEASKRLKS